MPQNVAIEEIGEVWSFPDDASPESIQDAIADQLGRRKEKALLKAEQQELAGKGEASTLRALDAEVFERVGQFKKGFAGVVPAALKTLSTIGSQPAYESEMLTEGAVTPKPQAIPEAKPLFQLGEMAQERINETFPEPENRDLWHDVSRGGGQVGQMIAGGTVAKGLGASTAAAQTLAIGSGAVQEFDDAFSRSRLRGDDPDTALAKSLGYSTVAAMIESRLGAGRLLRQLYPSAKEAAKKLTAIGVSRRLLGNFVAGGVEEGTQRVTQNWIVEGEPSMEGVMEEAVPGAIIQGIIGAPGAAVQPGQSPTAEFLRRANAPATAAVVEEINLPLLTAEDIQREAAPLSVEATDAGIREILPEAPANADIRGLAQPTARRLTHEQAEAGLRETLPIDPTTDIRRGPTEIATTKSEPISSKLVEPTPNLTRVGEKEQGGGVKEIQPLKPEDKFLENIFSKLAKTQPDWSQKGFVVIEGKSLRNAREKARKTAESIGFGSGIETFESPYFAIRKVDVEGVDQYTIHKRIDYERTSKKRGGMPEGDAGNLVLGSVSDIPTARATPAPGVTQPTPPTPLKAKEATDLQPAKEGVKKTPTQGPYAGNEETYRLLLNESTKTARGAGQVVDIMIKDGVPLRDAMRLAQDYYPNFGTPEYQRYQSMQPTPKPERKSGVKLDPKSPLTPMMAQYQRLKEGLEKQGAGDALLAFRLGDFYEFFFDDAKAASKLFKIALTKRRDVDMAGIPYHAAQKYFNEAIMAGRRIAIADIEGTPQSGKAIERTVTEILPKREPKIEGMGGARVKLAGSPQTYTVLETLPQTDVEKANGEQPMRIKNERTGKEEVVLQSEITEVKTPTEKKPRRTKSDLNKALKDAGLDPSVFPDAKSKKNALERAIAKIEETQKKLRGSRSTLSMGVPKAALDLILEAARLSLKAGNGIAKALDAAMTKARKLLGNNFDEDALRGQITDELTKTERKETESAFWTGEQESGSRSRQLIEAERFAEGKTTDEVLNAVATVAGTGTAAGLSPENIPAVLSIVMRGINQRISDTTSPVELADLWKNLDRAANLFQQQASESGRQLEANKVAREQLSGMGPLLAFRGLAKKAWARALKPAENAEDPEAGINNIVKDSGKKATEDTVEDIEEKAEESQSEKTSKKIIDVLAKSQSDTLSWSQRTVDGVRETVKWFMLGDVTEAEFVATMDTLGVKSATSGVLLDLVKRETAIREIWKKKRTEEQQAIRAAKAKARIEAALGRQPQSDADQILKKFSESQSDTLAWTAKATNQVRESFKGLMNGDIVESEFAASLETVGVSRTTINSLIGVARRELAIREFHMAAKEREVFDKSVDAKTQAELLSLIRRSGVSLSTLFLDNDHATQKQRREHLFNEIRKAFPNLSTEQKLKLEKALMDAWEKARLKIFRQQFKKFVGLPEVAKENIMEAVQPELIRQANLGTLSDEAFRAAVAKKLGLPNMDGETAKRMVELAQEAQAKPEGVLRNKVFSRMIDELGLLNQFHPFDIARDYWYANALSGTRTWVAVLSSMAHGVTLATQRTLDLALRGNIKSAAQLSWAYILDVGEGIANAIDVVASGDYTRRAEYGQNIDALLRGKGRLDTLEMMKKHGDRIWKRAIGQTAYARRMIIGLDYISAISTRGSEIIYGSALQKDAQQLEFATRRFNREAAKQAKTQAQAELGPSAKWVDVRARQLEILNEGVSQAVIDQATLMGEVVALNAPLIGATGAIHEIFKSFPKAIMAANIPGTKKSADALGFALSTVIGSPFIRATLNMVANASNYMPLIGGMNWARSNINVEKTPGYLKWLALVDNEGKPLSPQRRNSIISAQLYGIAMVGAAYLIARAGDDDEEDRERRFDITGTWKGMPMNERKARMAKGERPLSLVINGRYISYATQPMAGALVVAGNARDLDRSKGATETPEESMERMFTVMISGPAYIKDLSTLSGMSAMAGWGAMRTDDATWFNRILAAQGRNVATAVVPFASLVREIDTWFDPKLYRPKEPLHFWIANVPWMRESAAHGPEYSMAGIPVENYLTPQSRLIAAEKNDPLVVALGQLIENGITPKYPGTGSWIKDGEQFTPTQKGKLTYRHQTETLKAWREIMLPMKDEIAKMTKEEYEDFYRKELLPISQEIHDDLQNELDPDVLKRKVGAGRDERKFEKNPRYEMKEQP